MNSLSDTITMKSIRISIRFCGCLLLMMSGLIQTLPGQTLERQVISASGETLEQGGYTLDFSVGEMMTVTWVNEKSISQGFHQVWAVITAVEGSVTPLQAYIYPNPVPDVLHFESPEPAILQLSDINGNLLQSHPVNEGKQDLNVEELPSGLYLLRLTGQWSGKTKVFKMVKVQ